MGDSLTARVEMQALTLNLGLAPAGSYCIFSVSMTPESRYVLHFSDDTNIVIVCVAQQRCRTQLRGEIHVEIFKNSNLFFFDQIISLTCNLYIL